MKARLFFVLFLALSVANAWHLAHSKLIFLSSAMLLHQLRAFPSISRVALSPLGLRSAYHLSSSQVFFPSTTHSLSMVAGMSSALASSRAGIFSSDSDVDKRRDIKLKLFSLCAACDRGFSSVASERQEIEGLVNQLKPLSPEKNPTRNLYPFTQSTLDKAPLEAAWRMVYTSAPDVISLAANPLAQVQQVFQLLYRDGSAVNVVNLTPRFQNMLPRMLVGDGTVFRLKVFTKAMARSDSRLAVSFRKIEIKPVKLFSFNVAHLLPALRAALPQTAFFGADREENGLLYEKHSPRFFDVLYLDDDMLITQQASGGLFVGIRSSDSLDSFL